MLTGYSTNLPSDVLLDSGVLYVGNACRGATRGGLQFTPDFEIENVDFDGKQANIKGLDRKFFGPDSKIAGTLIEFGDTSTGNQVLLLEPGGTTASAGSPNVTTFTPNPGSEFLASGDYSTDVRLIFERGVGSGTKKYAAIYFPVALVKTWSLQGANKGEATIGFEICARRDMSSGTVATSPYLIEHREALPT
jgi:hypothetical protein